MPTSPVAISAPGKVLLAGGYLVLDREYTGLVFGLDARIHVHVQTLPTSPGVTLSEIIVKSPQFRDAEWRYGYRETEDGGGVEVTQLKGHTTSSQSRNKFVETALAYALTYTTATTPTKITPALITILADSDYYSHGPSPSSPTPLSHRFIDFNVPLTTAHKTGLGSSAALVTAFTTALLTHYLPPTTQPLPPNISHNLAQAAHCAAQGKIGSGFDVAAAVYGSCVYRRFSPSILSPLGEISTPGFANRLRTIVDATWDTQIDKSAATMQPHLRLVMCDVDCGSETVGLVKQVLAWRAASKDEATLLWATLQRANEDLARELRDGGGGREELGNILLTIRSLIRDMSAQAKVPIEPRVQTELLDACARKLFDGYQAEAQDSSSDGASIGKVRLLGVKQEMEGVKAEEVGIYGDWIK
ncbi:MAG: hypothetical protein Q9195_006132 [Heterodermia aff. obscurata]